MPRLVHRKKGRRVNIWLDGESDQISRDIGNLSNFVQMSLRQASSIMAFDIIIRAKNLPQPPAPTAEAIAEFNENYPLDELTQKRKNKNGTPQSLQRDEATDPH